VNFIKIPVKRQLADTHRHKNKVLIIFLDGGMSPAKTSYSTDSCTGPYIETLEKAENISRRGCADQLF